MGVTGLWTIAQPCARPVKLESLNQKRLAVDASIWIYQFLKAVRDKDGNALRNSHVVGFFRRICKLLFHGIRPVFVFDGGAPLLKRQTIANRKQRREGRREDAVRTAGKLLAVQMQRRAEEEAVKRKDEHKRKHDVQEDDEIVEGEKVVYVDEIQMDEVERQRNRQFRKKDQYHLPDLDLSFAEMGGPNDPRIMSQAELEDYARQFENGEEVNLYDFAKIDFEGPFFMSLPDTDRYNILNAARLRSRLRMGYSKEQLDDMFPDRMAFSRFQIERVRERNGLTQRLMNINGMNGPDMLNGVNGGGRIAGERGREYVLVKNDGVEGGWALGVVGGKDQGKRAQPINVDDLKSSQTKAESSEDEAFGEDDGFEDVPVEGLNRLPKRKFAPVNGYDPFGDGDLARKRQAVYDSRQESTRAHRLRIDPVATTVDTEESLFMPEDHSTPKAQSPVADALDPTPYDEDFELEKAIAMSLEPQQKAQPREATKTPLVQSQASAAPKGEPWGINSRSRVNGKSVLANWNDRSNAAVLGPPGAVQTFEYPPVAEDDDDEEEYGFEDIIQDARTDHDEPAAGFMLQEPTVVADDPFSGPLPFEKLNLKSSLFAKKKSEKPPDEEADAGGFTKEGEEENRSLPPWFSGEAGERFKAQTTVPEQVPEEEDEAAQLLLIEKKDQEVIDVDEESEREPDIIDLESDEDDVADQQIAFPESPPVSQALADRRPVDSELRMGDIADKIRAEPPRGISPVGRVLPNSDPASLAVKPGTTLPKVNQQVEDELVEWSDSDGEAAAPAGGPLLQRSKSISPVFEAVGNDLDPAPATTSTPPRIWTPTPDQTPQLATADSFAQKPYVDDPNDFNMLMDSDDDLDLIQALEAEATEHARFASELNSKPQAQNQEDYERELRTLRNQQKKDRRDADEVSHIMVTECQQLLSLFGLPYVTAPMEAEAQCAELVTLGLVDGIVTDDSDCFLFGGTRVYKNLFNQAKFVECYLASDLEKEFGLTRRSLVAVAQLLGSDYTEGVAGVGPVGAMEIISLFSPSGNSGFNAKDIAEPSDDPTATTDDDDDEDDDEEQSPLVPFRKYIDWTLRHPILPPTHPHASLPKSHLLRKFRKTALKLSLPPTFPSPVVEAAYLHPEVDHDATAFQWGVPDLDRLRSFLMKTVGWTPERTDEVLVPVVRDMNRRRDEGTQANITRFLEVGAGGTGSGTVGVGSGALEAGAGGLGSELVGDKRAKKRVGRMEKAMGALREGSKAKRGAKRKKA